MVDRPCAATELAEAAGVPVEFVERGSFGPDFDRVAYTRRSSTPSSATTSTSSPWPGSGRSSTSRSTTAFGGRDPQHPPGPPARLQGLARGRGRAGGRGEGHRLHRPRRHARGRRRPDPRPGGRPGPARRRRGACTSASRRSSAASIRRRSEPSWPSRRASRRGAAADDRGPAVRLRQDRAGRAGPGAAGARAGTWSRAAARPQPLARGRPRASPTSRERHRLPGDPRPPGRDAAPEDPRRDPRRPPKDDHRADLAATASSRSTSWSRTCTRSSIATSSRRHPSDELIDIGGPAMVRAAAKNHAHVGVVTEPADYGDVLDGAQRGRRARPTPPAQRSPARRSPTPRPTTPRSSRWFDEASDELLPPTSTSPSSGPQELRYGENPHQPAPATASVGTTSWWDGVTQHGGIALSLPQPLRRRRRVAARPRPGGRLGRPAVAIIKHANPCGAAVADDLADAYQRAFECDERSAFGGIVAVNRPIDDGHRRAHGRGPAGRRRDRPRLRRRRDRAPLATKRKNTRLLDAPAPEPDGLQTPPDHRRLPRAGCRTTSPSPRDDWRVVTDAAAHRRRVGRRRAGVAPRRPREVERDRPRQGRRRVGIGAGQQNRVESGQIAAKKAAGRAGAGRAPATRSTRSPTASRPRPRPVWP